MTGRCPGCGTVVETDDWWVTRVLVDGDWIDVCEECDGRLPDGLLEREQVGADRRVATDGGHCVDGTERIVRKENKHGAMKDFVRVEVSETQIVEVPKRIRNPLTGRRHDLTKLSDDGYLKPFLAIHHASNGPDVIDLGSSPVLTFDKDRWGVEEQDGQVVLVKRDAESKFGERLLGNGRSVDTATDQEVDRR